MLNLKGVIGFSLTCTQRSKFRHPVLVQWCSLSFSAMPH